MNPEDYGDIIVSNKVGDVTRYVINNKERAYQIDVSEDSIVNVVKLLGSNDFGWRDTKLTEGFKREIGKSTIYFVDGESVLVKQQRPAKTI